MKERLRYKIWRIATRQLQGGCILPMWAIWLRYFLFPLDSFYWRMSDHTGFNIRRNAWQIDGMWYDWHFFDFMKNANSQIVKIWREDDKIFMQEIKKE